MNRYLKNIDTLIAAVAGFYIIYLFTTYSGIGVSPDSIMYTSTARNLHAQGLMHTFRGPLVDFPVFYPLFLALVTLITGADPIAAGPILNGLLFAALIWMCGWIMAGFQFSSRLYKWLLLLALVVSPPLLQVYVYLWSETLFILFILIFIIAFKRYQLNHHIKRLLIAALIAAIACITRYAAVTIIGTGALLLLLDRELLIRQKIKHLLIFSTAAVSLLIANLLRNALITGTVTGPREPSVTPFSKNLLYFGSVVCEWIGLSPDQYDVFAIPIACLLLIGFILALTWNAIKHRLNTYENLAITFFVVYALFMILSATFSRYERINSRLLSPLFIPLLWGCTSWASGALKQIKFKRKMLAPALLALAVLLLNFSMYKQVIDRYNDWRDYGIPGYTDDSWNKSEFAAFLKNHPEVFKSGYPIYSDAHEGVYFVSSKTSNLLPHRFFKKDVARFYQLKRFYLIWFTEMENPELINLKDVQQVKSLKKLYEFPEGAIYLYDEGVIDSGD
jgi:hypothetical protein